MARKHHKTDGRGDVVSEYKPKKKAPVKFIEQHSITEYRRQRDRVLYKMYPYLREELTQHWNEKDRL